MLKEFLAHLAKRYIAGVDIAHAVAEAKELNALGISATIDNLGENVRTRSEAGDSVKEYCKLLEEIEREGVDSTVSVKLTHLGLDISDELAMENLEQIVRRARELNNSVRVDMEGSRYTAKTIAIVLKLREKYPNLGVAVQSYLLRSKDDIERLMENKVSVRLVKGAYKEPPGVAYQRKEYVDSSFDRLMKELLLRGVQPAIATHDERLIEEALRFASEKGVPKGSFDIEMLLGIKRTLQRELASRGYRVRVYVPYGRNWLPYTLRRLRERKENLFFLVRNVLD